MVLHANLHANHCRPSWTAWTRQRRSHTSPGYSMPLKQVPSFGDDNVDQRDLLFQCIARLERTARKAEEAGNYACVIGAVAQMNRMLSLGADTRGFRGHPTHAYRR